MIKARFKMTMSGLVLILGMSTLAPGYLAVTSAAHAAEWHEGGTLHQATALEWQQASHANKLATAADIITDASAKELLRPELQKAVTAGSDSYFPLAHGLVKGLDAAFFPDPDPAANRAMFVDQRVNETMAQLMEAMGWLK